MEFLDEFDAAVEAYVETRVQAQVTDIHRFRVRQFDYYTRLRGLEQERARLNLQLSAAAEENKLLRRQVKLLMLKRQSEGV